jgi:hypothetical protein
VDDLAPYGTTRYSFAPHLFLSLQFHYSLLTRSLVSFGLLSPDLSRTSLSSKLNDI